MELLTPMTALYAALISVPLLLLLYFLKLKRRDQIVSSTLLWKRAIQDLQVNAPFQKIRRNLLLLLQMLLLLSILFALAKPVLPLISAPGNRFVLLIDRSASMNATDIKPSRLAEAKKQAAEFVRSLRSKTLFSLKDDSDQLMVMAFDENTKVMSNFTSDKKQLLLAIEAISPSDKSSSMAEAVTVARAFAQSPGVDTNNRSAETPARLILFSDGQIRDLDQIVVGSEELIFNCIGQSCMNVGITEMRARRSYDNPDQIDVFAAVSNYNDENTSCDIQLSLNGNVHSIKTVNLPSAQTDEGSGLNIPSSATINLTITHADSGVLELRLLKQDDLSADDAAWAVILPPKKLSVLLVTEGNMVLESALKACPVSKIQTCTLDDFNNMNHTVMSVEQPYDVIVLDNVTPKELPRSRYLVFGKPPEGIDVPVSEVVENQFIADWRQSHSVLKYVNMTNLFAAESLKLNLPRDAEVLAEFTDSAAIAVIRRGGSVFLLTGFDILQSNWPFEPGFVLFCYNAIEFLGIQIGQEQDSNLKISEPIILETTLLNTEAVITGPDMYKKKIISSAAGTFRFPGIERAGIYNVQIPEQPERFYAVNMLDAEESNIGPIREITLSGRPVTAEEKNVNRSSFQLWPWLVILALCLACFEWFIYNSRVRI